MSHHRVVVSLQLATNRPHFAYGTTIQWSIEDLEHLADLARNNRVPLNLNHDGTQTLNSHFISAEVIEIEDGFKAVEAQVEVDSEVWLANEERRIAAGAPGGVSIGYTKPR